MKPISINEAFLLEAFSTLHASPELSGQEIETSKRIGHWLSALGIPYTLPGHYAVVGEIEGRLPGPTVGLRADIDALPILEQSGSPWPSQHPGVMHACGHDAHTSILLGVAKALLAERPFAGNVRLLFEPAEETTGGARTMIEAGCLSGVDAVLGLHVAPELPVGQVSYRPGPMSGASDDLDLRILGHSAHGAYPQKGTDAILIAAQVVTALQALISRETSPLDSAVLTLGTIEGGTAPNIIAGEVRLRGTLRTLQEDTRKRLLERIGDSARGVATGLGGSAEVRTKSSYPALRNDAALTAWATACFQQMLPEGIQLKEHPSLGVESFSFFAQQVPGFYYELGCGSPSPIHTPEFCIDTACLALGASLQAQLTLSVLASLQ